MHLNNKNDEFLKEYSRNLPIIPPNPVMSKLENIESLLIKILASMNRLEQRNQFSALDDQDPLERRSKENLTD